MVQSLSPVLLFATPGTVARQALWSSTVSQRLLKFMSSESMILSEPSYPLLPSCPFAFNLPQHQGHFQWVRFSHQVAKYCSFHFSDSSSNEYSRLISLVLTSLISLQSKGLSRVFCSTSIQKHQFFGTQPSSGPALTPIHDYWENCSFDYTDLCWQSDVSTF